MQTGRRNAAVAVAGVVILLGIVQRYESAQHEITGRKSSCAISKTIDCDKVQASTYADVLGVPLSVWGAAGHGILIAWLLAGRIVLAGVLALLNLLLALFLAYTSFFRIGALCLYCSAMQIGIVALAILVLPAARRTSPQRGLALPAMLAGLFLALAFAGEAFASQRSAYARLFQPSETVQARVDVAFSPILGDPSTEISTLLFLDFGCPYCRGCFEQAVKLQREYPDRVHFIVKHYPLDRCNDHEKNIEQHPGACDAAWAAAAAARFRRAGQRALLYLFDQEQYFPQVLEALGGKIGADSALWEREYAGAEAKAIVQRDMDDAHALRVVGVPRCYVRGRPMQTVEQMIKTVRKLARQ